MDVIERVRPIIIGRSFHTLHNCYNLTVLYFGKRTGTSTSAGVSCLPLSRYEVRLKCSICCAAQFEHIKHRVIVEKRTLYENIHMC